MLTGLRFWCQWRTVEEAKAIPPMDELIKCSLLSPRRLLDQSRDYSRRLVSEYGVITHQILVTLLMRKVIITRSESESVDIPVMSQFRIPREQDGAPPLSASLLLAPYDDA